MRLRSAHDGAARLFDLAEVINATQLRGRGPYSNEDRQDNELSRCFSGNCATLGW